MLSRSELIDDPCFRTPELRRANGPELVAIIDASAGAKTMAEWKEILRVNGVIWGPAPSTQQAASDPQMEANGVFAEIEPEVGEHTVEVLKSVGLSEEAVRNLIGRGAAMSEG